MFNRSKFNIGKFNTISGSISSSNATMLMNMDVAVSGNTKFSLMPNIMDSGFDVVANANRVFDIDAAEINNICEMSAICIRAIYVSSTEAEMQMETLTNSFRAFGFESITLNARGGLVLQPNDELRIDTEKMTVELNGVNVIKYFSTYSDFFKLKPSENILIYSNGVPSSDSEVKVLWKDRWL